MLIFKESDFYGTLALDERSREKQVDAVENTLIGANFHLPCGFLFYSDWSPLGCETYC